MGAEWGIFNDEGCVESGFRSKHEADEAVATRYDEDDDVTVMEMCHDHEDQPREGCDECAADEIDNAEFDDEEDS